MERLEKLLYEALKDAVSKEKFQISTSALLRELGLEDLENVDKSDIYLHQTVLSNWITRFLYSNIGQRLNDEMLEKIRQKGLKSFNSGLNGVDVLRTRIIRETRGANFTKKLDEDERSRRETVKQIIDIIKEIVKSSEDKTKTPPVAGSGVT